jgi:threonine dehydrogenase-like Zn-dependent dehydrogenase
MTPGAKPHDRQQANAKSPKSIPLETRGKTEDLHAQDGRSSAHGRWRFGDIFDGAQAEYLLVPDAMENLALVPNRIDMARFLASL